MASPKTYRKAVVLTLYLKPYFTAQSWRRVNRRISCYPRRFYGLAPNIVRRFGSCHAKSRSSRKRGSCPTCTYRLRVIRLVDIMVDQDSSLRLRLSFSGIPNNVRTMNELSSQYTAAELQSFAHHNSNAPYSCGVTKQQ